MGGQCKYLLFIHSIIYKNSKEAQKFGRGNFISLLSGDKPAK